MSTAPIPWKHVRNVLVVFAPLWGGASLLFAFFGVSYALFSSDVYSARQPLVVRNEAASSIDRMGRFSSQSELKAAQETILEMTQNPEVVAAALRKIGPESGQQDPHWPSTKVIDSVTSNAVNLLAAQGSEFGNTEVVYLQVKASSQPRAVEFCRSMFESLTRHLRTIRQVRADSVIAELTYARDQARQNLQEAASRMREIEVRFATDLGELRNLNDAIAGDGTNRRTLEQTVSDLQVAELELEKLQSLHELLMAGSKNPDHLLVSGSDLLTLQPSLLRLKDGLIDAQIASSQLSASRTENHPAVRNARAAEQQIRRRMQDEATTVVQAMQPVLRLERARVSRLTEKKEQLSKRLEALAAARMDYATVDAEVAHRTTLLEEAERALAEAHASRTAALSTNLVAELGPPRVSDHPIGPGGTVVTLGSATAGLLFGLGAVFLIAPGPSETRRGRRWTDFLQRSGRRAADQAVVAKAATGGAGVAVDRRTRDA
ncbi:GumC domain-containing protein [Novipirellula artificiosorum]|uniref:Uncharacterized protein n=1 Tax=Novipirellula artificiosorum TaxID=2528016 RepID=A0A5C6DF80_9BACT|nr:hypothetical protein [Novipirellula artificiosorum]TWU33786.1 hypothetical protein Poly41_47840 [Novipirellula artificiosorum]